MPPRSVDILEVTDDNILEAIDENWQINTQKEKQIPPPQNKYEEFVRKFINHPLDVEVVTVALVGLLAPISSAIMYAYKVSFIHLILHSILLAVWTRRYVLALHVSSHSALFKKEIGFMNHLIPVLLAPFFGQTPYSYYWHHLKMHHVTDNGPEDLSCTLFYQRDNFFHFVCYFFRFYFLAWFELPMFFVKRGRVKEPMRMMAMEISCYLAMIHLALNVDFMATFMSFILPFNIVRFGMMQGNWVQHSFLERTNPLGGGLQNSITLVHCVYNRDCFNDGYHASHHLHPLRHYLEHPANLIQNRQTYYESKAIVFKETSYDYIWWLLMTKNYEKLASYWVHIGPKEEEPSCAEIVKMLKEKTRIFSREEITPFLKKGK